MRWVRCHGDVADDGAIEWLTLDDQFGPLVRLAALLVGSPATAEDLVQEAFAKLHGRFDRIDEPRAWLRVVVVNASRNERRRLGRLRRHLDRQAGGADAGAEAAPSPEPADAALLASLRRLPDRQRAAVVLRYYLGLSEAEIAATLGIRPGTVKSRLHRALATMRTELEEPSCGS